MRFTLGQFLNGSDTKRPRSDPRSLHICSLSEPNYGVLFSFSWCFLSLPRPSAVLPSMHPKPQQQALALLTAASTLSAAGSAPAADDLVDKCAAVMREYRGTVAAAARAMSEAEERQKRRAAAKNTKDRDNGGLDKDVDGVNEALSAPAHGGGKGVEVGAGVGDGADVKIDVFATLRYGARSQAGLDGCTYDLPPLPTTNEKQ